MLRTTRVNTEYHGFRTALHRNGDILRRAQRRRRVIVRPPDSLERSQAPARFEVGIPRGREARRIARHGDTVEVTDADGAGVALVLHIPGCDAGTGP